MGKVSIAHRFGTDLPSLFPCSFLPGADCLETALDSGTSLKMGCATETLGSAARELFLREHNTGKTLKHEFTANVN